MNYKLNKFFDFRIPPIFTYLLVPIIQIILLYYNKITYFSEISFIFFVISNFIFEFNTNIFYKSEDIIQNKINYLRGELINNLNDLIIQSNNNNPNITFINQIDNNNNNYELPFIDENNYQNNNKLTFINDDDLNDYNKLTILDKLMFFGSINKNSDNNKININFNYYDKKCNIFCGYDYNQFMIQILYVIYFFGITPKIFIVDINKICNTQ
jgi:hypothetical protein